MAGNVTGTISGMVAFHKLFSVNHLDFGSSLHYYNVCKKPYCTLLSKPASCLFCFHSAFIIRTSPYTGPAILLTAGLNVIVTLSFPLVRSAGMA